MNKIIDWACKGGAALDGSVSCVLVEMFLDVISFDRSL